MNLDWLEAGADWADAGHRWAVAVLAEVRGSSPREVGAVLAVREDGLMVGSVSGGCVEGAVVRAAVESIRSGDACQLEFGPDDTADPWQVGLTCGGSISVSVTPWPEGVLPAGVLSGIHESHANRQAFSLSLGDIAIVVPPPPRLVIVGAVHIAACLARLAAAMAYETVVIDPRCAFATPERFAVMPTRLMPDWPQQVLPDMALDAETYAVVLSHDPKIDDPALAAFLRSEIPYIGVLGGLRSVALRTDRLKALGFGEADLARLRQPVGLDIGAKSPEEIALSILAEIVAVRCARP